MRASLLYRIASGLLVLFAIGHTLGFRRTDPRWGADSVVRSMRATRFNVDGLSRTYWDFFTGFGLFVTVFLLFAAILAWEFGGLAKASIDAPAPRQLGICDLFCRHHSLELDVLLHHPGGILKRDWPLSRFGSLARGKALTQFDWKHEDPPPPRCLPWHLEDPP